MNNEDEHTKIKINMNINMNDDIDKGCSYNVDNKSPYIKKNL